MHKRRLSENFFNPPSNKKLSSQSIDRKYSEQTLNASEKPKITQVSAREVPITSIIQEKFANLKSKFSELDYMRQRLVESQSESRLDTETKVSNLINTRPGNSNTETFIQPRSPEKIHKTYSQENYEIELQNERKSTQKAILEKNLSERESQEKIKQLTSQLNARKKDIDSLKEKLNYVEKVNEGLEQKVKNQEKLISNQLKEIETLSSQLSSANQSAKLHKTQIKELEKNLKSLKESTSSSALKNLSNIILSKDCSSPTKAEQNPQLVNRYLDSLQELLMTDQATLSVIQKLENNNSRKAQQELIESKNEVIKRMQRTNLNIEEIERYMFDCRSPSTFNRSIAELIEFNSEAEIEKLDYLSWIKCQAAVVEDLLLISDTK